MNDLVILSAAPFEAEALCQRLKNKGIPFTYDCFGVGPIETAWKAPELARKYARRNILILGTAGTFSQFSSPSLVKAKCCKWLPTCAREGLGELIEGLEPDWDVSQKPGHILTIREVTVQTSPCITTTKSSFIDENSVENMELYSLKPVFEAAATFDAVFAITNAVGPEGRKQWRENFRMAADMTAIEMAQIIGKKYENSK